MLPVTPSSCHPQWGNTSLGKRGVNSKKWKKVVRNEQYELFESMYNIPKDLRKVLPILKHPELVPNCIYFVACRLLAK
jgi:hypothetical protein